MTTDDKNKLLDRLSVCYNRVNRLFIMCQESNMPNEEVQFERRKKRLWLEIEGLQRDLYREWIGSAQELGTKLDVSNKEVDKCIRSIEKNIDTANNIVKAIGYIDDAVKVAVDLVA